MRLLNRSFLSLKHHIRVFQNTESLPKLGWSGNSSDYRFGRLLTSSFVWRDKEHSLISVWHSDFVEWRKAAYKLGITKAFWYQIKRDLEGLFQESHFPEAVDTYSPELLFPYKDHYLTLTPVVSHSSQLAVQRVVGLPIHSLSFPHPSALGVLCGSLGGHVRMLKLSPVNSVRSKQGFLYSLRSYLEPYSLTAKYATNSYQEVTEVKQYSSLRLKRRARLKALSDLDNLLGEWLAPLIQAKLTSKNITEIEGLNQEEKNFLEMSIVDIESFSRCLNRKLHGELELNKYTRRFSYHQRLVGITQKRLMSLLKRVLSDKPSSDASDETFLVFKSLRINEANGLNNPYVAGMPSMIGLYGFLHQFERQLSDIYPDVSVASFTLHCSHYSAYGSIALPAPSIPDKEMRIKRSGIMPEFKFDGKFSIVVKLNRLTDNDGPLDIEQIKAALPERLWGGSVHPPYLYEDTEWASIVSGANNLKKYMARHMFFGNWISPEKQNKLDLNDYVELLKANHDLSLCLVGYDLLEPIKPRNVISGIHAFCEPLIDLCRLKQTFKVIRGLKPLESQLFWRYVPVSQNCTTLRVSPVCGDPYAASQPAEL